MTATAPPDWSAARYETFASELAPAAEQLVEYAAPQPGERVLDLATGTGNTALAAARRGARVTGVDYAPRLLEVARSRAAAEGLELELVRGDLHEPPVPEGSYDLVLSSFGVTFAADPPRALGAIARALAPNGRALLTAWLPQGPIDANLGVFADAVAEATGRPPATRFSWYDPVALAGVAQIRGAEVRAHEERLRITASSPEEYLERGERDHPLSATRREPLERAGTYAATCERALAVLRDANEDPGGFVVHSPYRVIELRGLPSSPPG
jgi:SAM-dependent methyltransferase